MQSHLLLVYLVFGVCFLNLQKVQNEKDGHEIFLISIQSFMLLLQFGEMKGRQWSRPASGEVARWSIPLFGRHHRK
jgi:hypothetical protein